MTQYGHLTRLDAAECRQLLAGRAVGRVGWQSPRYGLQVLPVNYVLAGETILFRTEAASVLAELTEPKDVVFQVDDVDPETATGWSVLVQGRSADGSGLRPAILPDPWPPGERTMLIAIEPSRYTGRSQARD